MVQRSNLDRDVHARRKVELLQFIHGLGGGIKDVNEPLVRALLESLLGFFIGVRRTQHGEPLDARGERDRAGDAGTGALDGIGDFARRLVYDAMVISLQSNTNTLSTHRKN